MKISILPGDFALVDSKKFCPKVVKYLMRSPTIWHDLFRMIIGKLEEPLHYHALMLLSSDSIIEQQSSVQVKSSKKLLNTNNNLFIFRIKNMNPVERNYLCSVAMNDLQEGYDIVNCIGKFLSWITGIKFFARYMQLPNQDVCINRIAYWALKALGETFGAKTHSELTTWSLYKYVIAHPEKFEIVYSGNPREDFNE